MLSVENLEGLGKQRDVTTTPAFFWQDLEMGNVTNYGFTNYQFFAYSKSRKVNTYDSLLFC